MPRSRHWQEIARWCSCCREWRSGSRKRGSGERECRQCRHPGSQPLGCGVPEVHEAGGGDGVRGRSGRGRGSCGRGKSRACCGRRGVSCRRAAICLRPPENQSPETEGREHEGSHEPETVLGMKAARRGTQPSPDRAPCVKVQAGGASSGQADIRRVRRNGKIPDAG